MRDAALNWLESYLHGRSICTVVDGAKSTRQAITSGVSHGSVLGPLLFVLHFRDLPSVVKGTCALFADDT